MSCGSRNHSRPSSDMATPRVVGTKSGRPSGAPARLNPLAPWDGGHGPGGAVVLAQQQARRTPEITTAPAPLLAMPVVPEAPSGSGASAQVMPSADVEIVAPLRVTNCEPLQQMPERVCEAGRAGHQRGGAVFEVWIVGLALGNECGTAQRRAVRHPAPHHATRRASGELRPSRIWVVA